MPFRRPLHAVIASAAAVAIAVPPAGSNPEPISTSAAPKQASASGQAMDQRPIVFAHRGASGYRPEHTIEAYEFAIQMGSDALEPDLVATKDGVLVARHEPWLGHTTDVADRPEFADRQTTKTVSGRLIEDEWFAEDFTLAELKTLRAVEPLQDIRQHNTIYDGRFEIATFQEIIDLAKKASRGGRQIGLFPETKHPTYFRSIGLPLEEPLIDIIKRNGLNRVNGPVLVQSFEPTSLRKLDDALKVPVVQAITTSGAPYDTIANGEGPTYADMVTPEGLEEIATYADWIGPNKNLVIPRESDGSLGEPSSLVADAKAAGLDVMAWTFRNENQYLPTDLRWGDDPGDYGDAFAEFQAFFEAGVEGVWADNPDTAMMARDDFLNGQD
ncbi:glycerophosphodiester phosphodiesterase [Phytoactinopolyspora mesophila]|uniref:glycerophosphodiester phosphodiesterase n=1 Tax=Phytoactinopolyspora mesophila TaxID=2650750 RepID=A0A7K3M3P1_9ACTN|nr:glycerophosphodiester phosphodiesterase [Phytoactinopolyspora mesophila]NDL57058.1 glycerophosphodiester phosphodiesterase [Phytoactinopolyspora mesophila]